MDITKIDDKLAKVLKSYKQGTLNQGMFNQLLTGDFTGYTDSLTNKYTKDAMPPIWSGMPSGMGVRRIGESNKVKLTPHNTSKLGSYQKYVGEQSMDIPLIWFSKEYLTAINNQIIFMVDHGEWVEMSKLRRKDFLVKMYIMCADSATREFWSSRLETLVRYKDYNINCPMFREEQSSFFIEHNVHYHDIKEEHANKGFYKVNPINSVNTIYVNDEVFCMEDPKKALARNSRLVMTPESINIGHHTVFIIESVPTEIADWFVSGAGYTPNSLLGRLGAMRLTSKEGCKFVTMPTPKDTKDDVIYLSKNSFKGALNGIYMAHYGIDAKSLLSVTEEDINNFKEFSLVERTFQGVTVKGYEIDVQLSASHFFNLHGLRSVREEDEDEQDIIIDGSLHQEQSSYYLEARELIENDPEFDLIGDIMAKIDAGDLRYSHDYLDLKIQEFSVAKWSYGSTGTEWMQKVLREANMKGSVEETLDFMTGNQTTVTINKSAIFQITVNNIFKGMSIPNGVFDPEQFQEAGIDMLEYQRRLNTLLYGTPNSIWDGLMGDTAKNLHIAGYDFYIPSGKTMKDYINFEEGSFRVFFSGPAAAFLLLVLSLKNTKPVEQGGTCWKTKHINHMVDMQQFLLGKNIDQFSVKGGHYTMLPAPWLKCSELTIIDQDKKYRRGWKTKHNERVTFSKMPVLFNKAVADMHMINGLPQDMFDIDDRMRLAMRNMMFCNNEVMLDHQNDTDGDMGRVSLTGGVLPVYDRLPEHMQTWGKGYAADEYQMNISWKNYTAFPLSRDPQDKGLSNGADYLISMNEAVHSSVKNKKYVGAGTLALFYLAHILEIYVERGVITFADSVKIRDGYAMGMQDEIIRGIKHTSSDTGLFEDANTDKLFFLNDEGEFNQASRDALCHLLKAKIGDSMTKQLNALWAAWDVNNNNKALALRKTKQIEEIELAYVSPDESCIKMLDSITRSYLNNVSLAQPQHAYAKGASIDKANANAYIMANNNVDMYKAKYLLLGQNMAESKSGTNMHDVYKYWGSEFQTRSELADTVYL